jgi:membrane protein DedA with SNARE-associated domain/rhodanese-related sulfurtransferase
MRGICEIIVSTMDSWTAAIAHHGYAVLFGAVLLEAMSIPVPAALALLVAGAAARSDLNLPLAFACALSALLLGDHVMFLAGRKSGWWLLSLLCRLSLNPESCILRSAGTFYRRGRGLLVVVKFLPGVNTMAPALAGSMNMRYGQFVRFDLAGAALYAGAYLLAGFVFSGAIEAVTRRVESFGHVVAGALGAAVLVYLGVQVVMWRKALVWRSVPFVGPADAARDIAAGTGVIYDVRSHGYYDPRAMRIQGSTRLDPNALEQVSHEFPEGKHIYLYCTCAREATSARVAYLLREKGTASSVIRGGLRAWRKAGFPVEAIPAGEMAELPIFE